MPERPSSTRIANVAFLVFFVFYTAGTVIWLLSGIPPVLADRIPAVHETLHRWGASDRGIVAISSDGKLGQRVVAGSRWVAAKELAVWSNTRVVIRFENDDPGHPHNFAIYDGNRAISHTGPIVRPVTEITFTAPPPGHYVFRDEFNPDQPRKPAELVAVEQGREIPAWASWVPGLRTAAAGAAIDSHDVQPIPRVLLLYLFSALNIGLGILLIRLRPNDLAARLLALGMVGTAAVFNAPAHSGLQEMPWLAARLHNNYHWFAGLAYVLALLVFPDGRLPAAWSRRPWLTWPLLALCLVAATVVFIHFRSWFHGDPTGLVLFFGVLIPVAGVTSQSSRLRQGASAAQRQQSRVLVWALSLALGVALFLSGLRLVLGSALEQELQGLAFVVFPVLFAAIPLTLTAVLVRYRLWDMDRVINQTLVYGTLTGLLGLAYVAGVAVLGNTFLSPILGRPNLFLVAATVAVALLFRPARDRIQAFIDRSFYRSRYDAARTLEAFGARLRDEIDLDIVAGELLAAADETMQPARMALWLRPGDGAAEEDQRPTPNWARSSGTWRPSPARSPWTRSGSCRRPATPSRRPACGWSCRWSARRDWSACSPSGRGAANATTPATTASSWRTWPSGRPRRCGWPSWCASSSASRRPSSRPGSASSRSCRWPSSSSGSSCPGSCPSSPAGTWPPTTSRPRRWAGTSTTSSSSRAA